jgi:hypothetical protein
MSDFFEKVDFGARREYVEHTIDHRFHAQSQRLDHSRGEPLVHQLTKPGVLRRGAEKHPEIQQTGKLRILTPSLR